MGKTPSVKKTSTSKSSIAQFNSTVCSACPSSGQQQQLEMNVFKDNCLNMHYII